MFKNTKIQKKLTLLTLTSCLILLPTVCSADIFPTGLFNSILDWIKNVAHATENTAKVVVTDLPGWMNTGLTIMTDLQSTMNKQNPNDANTQGRLLQSGQVTDNTNQATVVTGKNFNKFLTGQKDPMQNKIDAYKRPTAVTYTDSKGVKHTYSTTDASSLYAGNIHNAGQSKASKEYIKNANGSNFGVPDVTFKNPTPEAIDATAYNRFNAALATSSSNQLAGEYESRQYQASTKTSKKQHGQDIAVGNTRKPEYFESLRNAGPFARASAAMNSIFSMQGSLQQLNKTTGSVATSSNNVSTQITMTNHQSFGVQKNANAVSKESGNRKASGKKGGHE